VSDEITAQMLAMTAVTSKASGFRTYAEDLREYPQGRGFDAAVEASDYERAAELLAQLAKAAPKVWADAARQTASAQEES